MSINVAEIRTYLTNIKALGGLCLIGFALYNGFSDIPGKVTQYQDALKQNGQLEQDKNNLSREEQKLKAISKELDKLSTQILAVEADKPPELAAINVAQQVVSIVDSTNNTYVSLTPKGTMVYNVDAAVTLPVNLSTSATSGAAAPPPADGAAPAPAPAPAAPDPNAPLDPNKSLQAFQYSLEMHGTYVDLASFVHEVAKMKDFVVIHRMDLARIVEKSDKPDEAQPDLLKMVFEFSVPWARGNAPAAAPAQPPA